MSIFSKTQKLPTLEELRAKVESLENAIEPLKARRKELREAFAAEMAIGEDSARTGAELAAITAQIEATPRALELLRDEILSLEISAAEAKAAQKRADFLAFRKTVEPKLEAAIKAMNELFDLPGLGEQVFRFDEVKGKTIGGLRDTIERLLTSMAREIENALAGEIDRAKHRRGPVEQSGPPHSASGLRRYSDEFPDED